MRRHRSFVVMSVLVAMTAALLSGCNVPVRNEREVGPYERYDRLSLPEVWRGTTGARGSSTAGKADLKNGGSVHTSLAYTYLREFGPSPWEGGFTFANLDYMYGDYDWGGETRFFEGKDAKAPIDNRQSIQATLVQIQGLSEKWGVAAAISNGYQAETSACLGDGRATLGAFGAWYFWQDGALFDDDALLLAIGVAGSDSAQTIGRELSIFPVIQLIWNINPQTEFFILANRASLLYTFESYWKVGFTASLEDHTIRTDQKTVSGRDAVVTDRYVPVMLNVVYQPSIYVDVTAGVGAWLGRSIDVDNGYEVRTDRIDAQPAFNLQVIIYF